MRVTNLEPVNDGVSWTDKPFTYFVHVIDRSLVSAILLSLEDFCPCDVILSFGACVN